MVRQADVGFQRFQRSGRWAAAGTSSRMGRLEDSLQNAYRFLGFEDAAGAAETFRHLVVARIIEPPRGAGPLPTRGLERVIMLLVSQFWLL